MQHPDLPEKFAAILCDLERGALFSLTFDTITSKYRLTPTLFIAAYLEIYLLDVDSHDEVYR